MVAAADRMAVVILPTLSALVGHSGLSVCQWSAQNNAGPLCSGTDDKISDMIDDSGGVEVVTNSTVNLQASQLPLVKRTQRIQ